jgi:predicted alpha/beta-hydrolase family hydrolase
MAKIEPYSGDGVRGFLHEPSGGSGAGLVLTHGAGSDCTTPVLVETAKAFAAAGIAVLRCDLAFRQQRPSGPPFPATAAADRESLRRALAALRKLAAGALFLGGHSYGGRQASMLAADEPAIATALLLLSYPLHPPKKPEQLRTDHWPRLTTRAVFVHGTRDGFGTIEELESKLKLIPAKTQLIRIEGAGHDLKRGRFEFSPIVAALIQSKV